MKHLAAVTCLLWAAGGVAPLAFAQQPEIIIEMRGEDSAPAAPSLWDYNALQLTRKLRGKTREYVLYTMPMVSDKDRIVRSSSAEYALVEYDDGGNFRKFLFKAESPQTFITAAANAADVLAVNKKYGINIGLSQRAFENSYQDKASLENTEALPPQTALYKLLYTDINTPAPTERWFLFENKELSQTFETAAEKDAYLASLQPAQTVPATPARTQAAAPTRTVRKALISGGTEWDKATLPRVVNPKPLLIAPVQKKNTSQN